MKLVQADPNTIIAMAQLTDENEKIIWRVGLGLLCLLVMTGLILRKWRSAFLVSIISTSFLAIIITAIIDADDLKMAKFGTSIY